MRLPSLCLIAACGTDVAPTDNNDLVDPNRPTDGASLFELECASCHGDGSGTEFGPTILNPVPGFATFVVRKGRNEMGYAGGGMAPFDQTALKDPELAAIISYLGEAVKPTTGEGLYTRFCVNCHGADGKSGRVRKNIVGEIGEIAEKIRQGNGGTNYGARTSYMPRWTAAEITDAEIALLRTYILSL
jgi:mono/diheme cytochrome c family protein